MLNNPLDIGLGLTFFGPGQFTKLRGGQLTLVQELGQEFLVVNPTFDGGLDQMGADFSELGGGQAQFCRRVILSKHLSEALKHINTLFNKNITS